MSGVHVEKKNTQRLQMVFIICIALEITYRTTYHVLIYPFDTTS